MNIRFKHFLIALACFTGFFLLVFFSFGIPVLGARPVVHSLEPVMVRPGDSVIIKGSGFGRMKHRSKVLVAGQVLSSSAIGSWSDREIEIVVPDFNRSTLISVKTLKGESPSRVLINAGDFPVILSDPLLPGYPYLSYINPQSGSSGSIIEIHGQNFGNIKNRSRILVAIEENYGFDLLETPDEKAFMAVDPSAILLWSEHLVRFVLPAGAVTGPVVIATTQGYSNPFTVEVAGKGFSVRYGTGKRWSCHQEFDVEQVAAYTGNTLYLWLPLPVVSPDQRETVLVNGPENNTGLVRDNCLLVSLDNISTGEEYTFSLDTQAVRYPVKVEVQPWQIAVQYNPENPAVRNNLDVIPGFSRDDFKKYGNIALGIIRGESHPYTKARLIYDFILKRYNPSVTDGVVLVPEIPAEQQALDSRAYSLIFVILARGAGIPARPVTGIRLSGNEASPSAVSHTWAEFYLEGAGWFPVDPWLADNENLPEKYWGQLDADRVAFSQGWSDTVPMQPGSLYWKSDEYSLQKQFAETEGNIGSIRIHWIVPSVTKP